MPVLTLTKHHGLGNDFLVLLDADNDHDMTGDLARSLCDRHLGVGADGLIRATRAGTTGGLRMQLWNSDGTCAETSGNGIRCLAQAACAAGLTESSFDVFTLAGKRHVSVQSGGSSRRSQVRVSMGPVKVGEELEPGDPPGYRARPVDVGNPHLVVLEAELEALDLASVGARLSDLHGGPNVEFLDVESNRSPAIRTWERGSGETLACGTGSVAAAAAARAWGLVRDHVKLRNPGGVLSVDLSGEEAFLEGPAEFVARVEVRVP